MLPNAFIGKKEEPAELELAAELGPPLKALWGQLLAAREGDHGLSVKEWNSYSPKAGWSLRLKRRKRNILCLIPCRGGFDVAFVLGDKAVAAAREAKLPPHVLALIDGARRYAEGTGIRLEVSQLPDIELISKLTAIKLAH
ncbi:MAG: DUF3788 family protein [Acidobacteria bacterium]|nr:DUF3788 family protein [Acidobacteriota bacterium]